MTKKCRTFEESTIEHLRDDPEVAQGYIQYAIEIFEEDKNIGAFLRSLHRYIEAKGGMTWLAERTTVSRQHLYAALSEGGNPSIDNPSIDTLRKILRPLGYKLSFRV